MTRRERFERRGMPLLAFLAGVPITVLIGLMEGMAV